MARGDVALGREHAPGRGPACRRCLTSAARPPVHDVACVTTVRGRLAAAAGMSDWSKQSCGVRTLQEFHEADQLRLDV